uniref:Fe2OG dioxygenase domain-containing protein n=1 Tax=Macrostomum lignano TaxID=282301 RepID=A0A1I8F8F1_9PLAT
HGGGWRSVPQLLIHDSRCPNLQAFHRRLIAFAVSVGHRFRSSWARAPPTTRCSSIPSTCLRTAAILNGIETEAFLENSYAKSERLLTQLYHRVAKPLLCMFMSVTSANGFLRRGSMFVLSGEQFRRLIRWSDSGDHQQQQEPLFDSLLDLGAGDGNVTSHYAGYFRRVFATEMATVMTWRLAERGYTVVDPITWLPTQPAIDAEPELDAHYDLIGCFNLLDSGRLLLAVVVPLRQFCEFAPGNRPRRFLRSAGDIRGAVGQPSQQCAPAARLWQWCDGPRRLTSTIQCLLERRRRGRAGQRAFGIWLEFHRAAGQLRLTYYPAYCPARWLAGCFAYSNAQVTYYGPDIAKVFVFGKWHPMPRQLSTGQALAAQASPPFATSSPPTPTWPTSRFNFALVNRYATGDNYIGEHRDSEPDLDPSAPIVSLSLGAQRDFYFRQPLMGEKVQLALAGGSLLAMQPPTTVTAALPAQAEAAPAPFATTRCSAPTGLRRQSFSPANGAIPGDEMGLGQNSCRQTVAFLLALHRRVGGEGGVSARSHDRLSAVRR